MSSGESHNESRAGLGYGEPESQVSLVISVMNSGSLSHLEDLELSGQSTPEKIGNCLKHFPHVNNLSHCRMTDSKLFRNGLLTRFHIDGQQKLLLLRLLLMSFLLGIVLTHI